MYIYFIRYRIDKSIGFESESMSNTKVIELNYQLDANTYDSFKKEFEVDERNGKMYRKKVTIENVSFLGIKND